MMSDSMYWWLQALKAVMVTFAVVFLNVLINSLPFTDPKVWLIGALAGAAKVAASVAVKYLMGSGYYQPPNSDETE